MIPDCLDWESEKHLVPKPNIYIEYNDFDYFKESPNWDITFRNGALEFLDLTEEGEELFEEDYYVSAEIHYDITLKEKHFVNYIDDTFGIYTIEHDGMYHWNKIHEDLIKKVYDRYDYPELYL